MTATREHDGAIEFATPGVAGYVVMYLVACVVAPALLLAAELLDDGPAIDPVGVLPLFAVGTFFAGVYGAPAALVSTAVCHLALRGVWPQAVHVLGFGLVAAAVTVALFGVLGDELDLAIVWLGMIAGISAAAGRLAVSGRRWRTRLLDSVVPSLR